MRNAFVRFIFSGVFNTAITYALYVLLLQLLTYVWSYTIAYASGICLAYILNRYVVYRMQGRKGALALVVTIYVAQYVAGLGLTRIWVEIFEFSAILAPLFATIITIPAAFLLNRRVFNISTSRHRS